MSRAWSDPVKLCPRHPKKDAKGHWCKCDEPDIRWRYRMAMPDPITKVKGRPAWSNRFKSFEEANADQAIKRAAVVQGTYRRETSTTLGEWLDEWMQLRREVGERKPGTYRGQQALIDNWIKPHLGDVQLRDLTPSMAQRTFAKMARSKPKRGKGDRISAGTLLNVRSTLRTALDAAVLDDRITKNPLAAASVKVGQVERRSRKPLERDGLRVLLRVMAEDHLAALWQMAVFTGMRRGELCGLRWSDVELDGVMPVAHVRQQVAGEPGANPCPVCKGTHVGRLIQDVKSKDSKRDIPLHPFLVQVLRQQRDGVDELRTKWPGAWSEHDLVFPTDGRHGRGDLPGGPWRPDYVGKRFGALLDESGVATDASTKPTLHTLRSGLLSLVVEGGATVDLASKVAGHADAETTRRWYLKVAAESTRAALAAVVGDVLAEADSSDPVSDPKDSVGGAAKASAEAS